MCGILGTINIDFDRQLLDVIKHRGPDGSGIASFACGENVLKLGHRRLSILDLTTAGHQPILTDCQNYALVFNGEIYNHEHLRKQLSDEIPFKGHSDSETILFYLKEFGIEGIRSFNGIFALAFFDKNKKKLYLARDRFGVKPLYYYHLGETLIFASEIRPIKKTVHPRINIPSLVNILRQRYSPAPFTIYQDIYKLQPGELVSIDVESPTLSTEKSFFTPAPSPQLGSRKGELSKLINHYGDLFEKAVERQLLSDVEVGILLSGGIDSALIAAVASSLTKAKVKTFTVGYSENSSGVDESRYAGETAEVLGLDNFTTIIDEGDFLNSIKKTTCILEEPLGTTSIVPMYHLAKLASSHVKVVLSGQGADEPLGGYNKYRSLKILEHFRALRKYLPIDTINFKKVENDKARRFLTALSAPDNMAAFVEYNAVVSIEQVEGLLRPPIGVIGLRALFENEERFKSALKKKAYDTNKIRDLFPYCDLRSSLPDDMLLYADKLTMNFGLECRVPMLDNDLIDFLESLNTCYKFNIWNGKIIHKKFAHEYLPASIINRKKLAFKSPAKVWFRDHKESLMNVFKKGVEFNRVFNIEKVERILAAHSKSNNLENLIFLLLSLCYFLEGEQLPIKTAPSSLSCPKVA